MTHEANKDDLPLKLRTIVERSARLTQRQQWAYLEAAEEIERLRREIERLESDDE